MPFDGSGNYTPAAAPNFPAVGGATIASAYYNTVINDIASALSLCVTRDGQGKPTANMDWGGKNLTNVASFGASTATFSNALGVASGGTGVSTVPSNGQILVGNGSGYVLANITGSGGISITNGAGTIAISFGGALASSGFTMSSGRLIGRTTASTGAPEEISIGSGLSLSGGVLSATGGGGTTLSNLTINNSGSGAGSGATYNGALGVTISWNTIGAQPSTPQVGANTSGSSITPDGSKDLTTVTALAAGLTLANPTNGVDGRGHVIRIKDNGTPQTLAYGTAYRAVGVTLPTTTSSNKVLYLGIIYNAQDSTWDVVSVAQQA